MAGLGEPSPKKQAFTQQSVGLATTHGNHGWCLTAATQSLHTISRHVNGVVAGPVKLLVHDGHHLHVMTTACGPKSRQHVQVNASKQQYHTIKVGTSRMSSVEALANKCFLW